ncbi:unnamed protein product [Larinioides sclopetarius]|uniref:Uncharacterized protein n=1 Tax=Larinioides sclopetarius TaxID=280406 RepID=A0AAV2B5A8_9ARAC
MSFSRTIHLSTNGKLPYQEIQFTENVLKTRRKWITVSLVSVAIVAVSLITFGEGHIIVGSVFLSAIILLCVHYLYRIFILSPLYRYMKGSFFRFYTFFARFAERLFQDIL